MLRAVGRPQLAPGTDQQSSGAAAKHLAPRNVRRTFGQAQWRIRCEYSAHALFHRDLRQGVAHAVVRAGANFSSLGVCRAAKTLGVGVLGFAPRRRTAARGGNAEKDQSSQLESSRRTTQSAPRPCAE